MVNLPLDILHSFSTTRVVRVVRTVTGGIPQRLRVLLAQLDAGLALGRDFPRAVSAAMTL